MSLTYQSTVNTAASLVSPSAQSRFNLMPMWFRNEQEAAQFLDFCDHKKNKDVREMIQAIKALKNEWQLAQEKQQQQQSSNVGEKRDRSEQDDSQPKAKRRRSGSSPFYQDDIFQYIKNKEQCNRSSCSTDKSQAQQCHHGVDKNRRANMVDWIIKLTVSAGCTRATLHTAVALLDGHLITVQKQVRNTELQLIAFTCFFIATKFEEVISQQGQLKHMLGMCNRKFTAADVVAMETQILQSLQYKIPATTTAYVFMKHLMAENNDTEPQVNSTVVQLANYLVDGTLLSCSERYLPSQIASAALFVARQKWCSWDTTTGNDNDTIIGRWILEEKAARNPAFRGIEKLHKNLHTQTMDFVCDF